MNEPSIVTPQEAQVYEGLYEANTITYALAYTVATEPDRTRAVVAKALREAAIRLRTFADYEAAADLEAQADAVENGAPL